QGRVNSGAESEHRTIPSFEGDQRRVETRCPNWRTLNSYFEANRTTSSFGAYRGLRCGRYRHSVWICIQSVPVVAGVEGCRYFVSCETCRVHLSQTVLSCFSSRYVCFHK